MVDEVNSQNIGSPVKDFVSSFFSGLEEGLTQRGLIMCQESESFAKNGIICNSS